MAKKVRKCTCNPGMSILAIILLAIAAYVLVGGFVDQLNGRGSIWIILLEYVIGLIILMIAKMCKWKGHMYCPLHGASV